MAARWGVIVGVVGIAAWTPRLQAQQRPAAPAAAQAKLETILIRPNVYVIFGAGANVKIGRAHV